VLVGDSVTDRVGGDRKRGKCFVMRLLIVIHYSPNFRPSPSHLCFLLVLRASVAWTLTCGMVDMAVFGVWTGSTMVVISDIIAAAPTVISVIMIFDRVCVGGLAVEPMLSGLGWVLMVRRGWPLR
jgi:hypothetical protein